MSQARPLEAKSLCFSYEGKEAVKDVSFALEPGEFLSVVGPNGSGKSTLLKCLCRILSGWRGAVLIDGVEASKLNQRQLAKSLGYVPQAGRTNMPFTVWDFALLGRYPHIGAFGGAGAIDKLAVRTALESVGIGSLSRRRMDSLSGGERQLALLAAAIAQGARTLLLDEPGAFLDCNRQASLNTLLRRMNTELGLSVICVTHDLNQALSLGGRILALKDGAKAFLGTPQEALLTGALEKLYSVEFEHLERGGGRLPWLVPKEAQL